jgi:hypothetical protein
VAVEAVAVAGDDDDGGDGVLAAVVVVGRPEKLALQRPSFRHSTASLRRAK